MPRGVSEERKAVVALMAQPNESETHRIERYELLAELAAGGMATVYLARLGGAGGFQRLYAIKKLHPHLAHEREFVEMFLDEARLAARIHHPNVVPILEVCTNDVGYYLVMEYIEGESLARLLSRCASRGERIPWRIGVKVVLDALAGLEAAHTLTDDFGAPLNIVHRDVSPQNVMVGVDGTARITDFGVARAATRLTTTRAGQLKGKLGYMAPEQAGGEEIDRRADIFAMGVILFETLAGRRLFKGRGEGSDAESLRRLLYEPIPRLADTVPDLPHVFSEVCAKALERDLSARFATCSEFADALESACREAGGIASTREVAAFVDDVAGPEIAKQREIVRSWVARSQISSVGRLDQPATLTGKTSPFALQATLPEAHASPSPRSRSPALIAAVGMASLAVIAAVAIVVWSSSSNVRAVAPAPTSAEASAPTLPDAAPGASTSASGAPAATAPASAASSEPSVPAAGSATRRSGRGRGGPSQDTGSSPSDLDTNPYR